MGKPLSRGLWVSHARAFPRTCATLQAPPRARPEPAPPGSAPDRSLLAGSRKYACVRCSHGGGGGGCGCGRRCDSSCTAGVRRGAGSCGPGYSRQGPEDARGRGSLWTAPGPEGAPSRKSAGSGRGRSAPGRTVYLHFLGCSGRFPIRIPSCIRFVSGSSQHLQDLTS